MEIRSTQTNSVFALNKTMDAMQQNAYQIASKTMVDADKPNDSQTADLASHLVSNLEYVHHAGAQVKVIHSAENMMGILIDTFG